MNTMTTRRLVLTFSALGLSLLMGAAVPSPAQALIEYPYCMKVYTRAPYEDCSYSTLAQCQMSASGRSAMCYRDPFYAGRPGSPYVIKQPRVPYSPFGNIDPDYDPYRVTQAPGPHRAIRHKHKRKHHAR
ncbi:DUF3551 domain-containing protein [[Pseudomonas] carboxydohydrogena]|uniref:DUF3551 domain-containing protein n=1 Tax=Afipia carboxydohydrogena TaxID=290 RepID=A0ABY8BWN6_AFICR|nr:DUF3551 domain-containing protein [[Pseudomonas] carboxydohydrogena]WEF53055.1 DUF3551 domain-containing protein [[Pseudomonas] carboxydohydrogena]